MHVFLFCSKVCTFCHLASLSGSSLFPLQSDHTFKLTRQLSVASVLQMMHLEYKIQQERSRQINTVIVKGLISQQRFCVSP